MLNDVLVDDMLLIACEYVMYLNCKVANKNFVGY